MKVDSRNAAAEIKILLDKFEQKRGKINLSLERIIAFLEKIGSPHLNLPPVIHIAGTNGKGSTLAFLRAMIEADGKTCHVYTSPHLVKFNERIVIGSHEITDDELLKILQETDREYENYKNEIELTFFELTTVAAFIAFAKNPADYLLLETGLGGRFDATNLVPNPVLTIITPISYDHMEFLGGTLARIAYEKAGIMKQNVPCISAPQNEEIIEVLSYSAKELGVDLLFAATHKTLPELGLKGEYQKVNATVAVAAARNIGLSEGAIAEGLVSAKWRARMQKLVSGELVEALPRGFELWLDGAHNIAGAEALSAEISKMQQPVYLIFAMMNTRDPEAYLQQFKNKIATVYTIEIPDEINSAKAADLAKAAEKLGYKAKACANASAAISEITAKKDKSGTVVICGSLYLAGKILETNS